MTEIEVLLTGEGETDYGWKDYCSQQWTEGAVAKLIRNCAQKIGDFNLTISFADRREVNKMKLQRGLAGLHGKAIPVRKFYTYMREKGFNYGVFYCDADRDSGANNSEIEAKKRFKTVYSEALEGVPSVTDKEYIVVPMIALRMIESWLLSDIGAFEAVYGELMKQKEPLKLPVHPELLWGKKDNPNSGYPKNVLCRICKKLNYDNEPTREDYIKLAENTDIDVLCDKCSVSFQRFFDDFSRMITLIRSNV